MFGVYNEERHAVGVDDLIPEKKKTISVYHKGETFVSVLRWGVYTCTYTCVNPNLINP